MSDKIAETIISKIKAHASPDAGEVTLETELTELGIHSLELTEIIFDLEDEYGIQIEMSTVEAWSNLASVKDIVEAVREIVRQKG
jgi:nodulation protein F